MSKADDTRGRADVELHEDGQLGEIIDSDKILRRTERAWRNGEKSIALGLERLLETIETRSAISKYGSVEAFAEQRLGMSRSTFYRCVDHAKVDAALRLVCGVPKASESVPTRDSRLWAKPLVSQHFAGLLVAQIARLPDLISLDSETVTPAAIEEAVQRAVVAIEKGRKGKAPAPKLPLPEPSSEPAKSEAPALSPPSRTLPADFQEGASSVQAGAEVAPTQEGTAGQASDPQGPHDLPGPPTTDGPEPAPLPDEAPSDDPPADDPPDPAPVPRSLEGAPRVQAERGRHDLASCRHRRVLGVGLEGRPARQLAVRQAAGTSEDAAAGRPAILERHQSARGHATPEDGRSEEVNLRRLLDVEPVRKRKGTTKALVVIDKAKCPACAKDTVRREAHEDALVRHGGYGATRRTRAIRCSDLDCGWYMVAEVTEVRPPR